MRRHPPYETEFSEEFWFNDQGSRSLTHRNRFSSHPSENQMVKNIKPRENKRNNEQSEENKE